MENSRRFLHTVSCPSGRSFVFGAHLPESLQIALAEVMTRLHGAHFHVYAVGGCVRDAWLGLPVHDVDVATNATPAEVMNLFERTVPTGLQHGTVTVLVQDTGVEVTTFRTEEGYRDGRRPDRVVYVHDIEQDLSRRDFTMNAMAIGMDGKLCDPFGGLIDLERRCVRAVGNPRARFQEDGLRLLRALRFATTYQCTIEPHTWEQLLEQRSRLRVIAMERVGAELDRMLAGDQPQQAIRWLFESRLWEETKVTLPFLPRDTDERDDPWPQITELVSRWIWWLLSMGLDDDAVCATARALRWSEHRRKTVRTTRHILRQVIATPIAHAPRVWCEIVLQHGHDPAQRAHSLMRVAPPPPDAIAHPGSWLEVAKYGADWMQRMPIASLAQLAIDGQQVTEMFPERSGRWIGACLNHLLREVVFDHVQNDIETLRYRAVLWYTQHVSDTICPISHRYFLETIDSTQSLAKMAAQVECPDRTTFVARCQRAGYGTRGRSWYSPEDEGIWLSLVVRPPWPYAFWGQRIAAVTVAVCHAVRTYTGLPIHIKWPNDLMLSGRKVGGILCENLAGGKAWIIGVGINGAVQRDFLPVPLCDRIISLSDAMPITWQWAYHRLNLLEAMLEQLDRALIPEDDFATVRERWWTYADQERLLLNTHDQPVCTGRIKALTDTGSALVEEELTGKTIELVSVAQIVEKEG